MSLSNDLRRIYSLLRPEFGVYWQGLAALLLVNASDVLAPVFMAVAVDLTKAALTGESPGTPPLLRLVGVESESFRIGTAVALYLGMQLCANAFRYPMLMRTAVPSHRVAQGLRNALVDRMLRLSRSFYDRSKSGDLMSLVSADVPAVRMMLGPGILVGTDTVMLVTFVTLVLATLSWKLTLVAMIPLPVLAIVTNRLAHAEYDRYEAVQQDVAALTERARESYAGIRIVQGYAREGAFGKLFAEHSWRHLLMQLRLARVRSVFDPTLDLMLGASSVLVLLFGGLEVVAGRVSLGTFVAFLFLVGYLSGPMVGFGWSVTLFQRGRASLGRIDEMLAEPVTIADRPDAAEANGPGRLEIRGLSFRYSAGGEQALGNVELEVGAGRLLGVIGPVGSGKSTLAQLLTRLYEAPEGTIFLDGRDIRGLSLASLRRQVVVAPQETFLFSDTIARNILLGAGFGESELTGEDRARAERAARLACLHDEVVAMPRGYDTMLGERGVTLSGGQRQRLSIARAIVADPRVLVLDDCLSAVDARTEEAILRNLNEVFRGRTGIVISHRVRAVQRCDEIVVLDAGRIVERGDHGELLRAEGWYAGIAAEQVEEERARASEEAAEPPEGAA